jgi:rhodanese-related sulfurtransferase
MHWSPVQLSMTPSYCNVVSQRASPDVRMSVSQLSVIICYAQLGWRSASVGEALLQQGLDRPVYNVEGSIFKWANEGKYNADIVARMPM